MWDSTDYELDWPRDLFRGGELHALCTRPHRAWTAGEIELLLREAFHTDVPVNDFTRASSLDGWAETATGRDFINDLLANLDQVREYAPPRPYWPERRSGATKPPPREPLTAREAFYSLVASLEANGYLARDFAKPCIDDDPDAHMARDLRWKLKQRLHREKLWPLESETWDNDTFYGLVEAFHDLVARPRRRWDHDHGDCGPHFEDFDTDAGRRVYRALVNRLLAENAVELRLADDGEDAGRLVHVVDEARSELVERVLATPDIDIAGRVEHAIALFRRRDAGTEDKRLAVVALAGILERRLPVIKQTPLLTKKDEGALFDIANNFGLRHQDIKQQREYDPAFLEWIFWWYLATIELTDQIIARQDTGASETA